MLAGNRPHTPELHVEGEKQSVPASHGWPSLDGGVQIPETQVPPAEQAVSGMLSHMSPLALMPTVIAEHVPIAQ